MGFVYPGEVRTAFKCISPHSFTSSSHEARNVRFWELGPDRVGELLIAGPVASSAATRDKKKQTGNTGIQNTNSPHKRSHLLRRCAFSLAAR